MNPRVLITAGPTREFIDPVRYLSNRSSGKMGYALAAAAQEVGAAVTVISGPTNQTAPEPVVIVPVISAEEMATAVAEQSPQADIIIMAAAVCDFRPRSRSPQKIKKAAFGMQLDLEATPDILSTLGRSKRVGQLLVGFALETADLVDNARAKLQQKNVDLIIANHADALDADRNQVTVLDRSGNIEEWPEMTKKQLAQRLIERIVQAWHS